MDKTAEYGKNNRRRIRRNSDGTDKGEIIMQRIAEFEKVSFEQFKKDCMNRLPYCLPEYYKMTQTEIEQAIQKAYDTVTIPKRSTSGSAGYDFVSPFALSLEPQQGAYVPTGIRCRFNAEGWVLMIYPRSSLGINNRMQLDNSTGIIDAKVR